MAHRAWTQLKAILQSNSDDYVRTRVAQDMMKLEELLAAHDLAIAEFFLAREHGGVLGARDRLRHITEEFPHYSKMDRVLLRLSDTYMREEKEDLARNYLLKLVCKYPGSDDSIKAFERLNQIGSRAWEGCDKYIQ
jgi:outer membrane protein assembly factor BamD (BamD/ComL family)